MDVLWIDLLFKDYWTSIPCPTRNLNSNIYNIKIRISSGLMSAIVIEKIYGGFTCL